MIRSKLPNVGTTIFTTMSQLAVQTGALNLSQGFPDFNGPQALLDAGLSPTWADKEGRTLLHAALTRPDANVLNRDSGTIPGADVDMVRRLIPANGVNTETLSSRANRARSEGRRWGCILCRWLDWLDPHHCRDSAGT